MLNNMRICQDFMRLIELLPHHVITIRVFIKKRMKNLSFILLAVIKTSININIFSKSLHYNKFLNFNCC